MSKRAWTLTLLAVAGGLLGVQIVADRATRTEGTTAPPVLAPAGLPNGKLDEPARVEFALRPDDVQADRETPAVAVDAKGRILLAYASQTGDLERTIYLSRSTGNGKLFGPAVAWRKVPIFKYTSAGKSKPMAFSTHVLPRLTSSGEAITLGWVEAVDGGPRVVYFAATSTDGGARFSDPKPVHGATASKPGFTTIVAADDGTVVAAWLDGREGGQKPFASTQPPGTPGFGPESLVFAGPTGAGVCPCCDLAAVKDADGALLVAFRDNDADRRDIAIARSLPNGAPGFAKPVTVGDHRWSVGGCPHDGPSLALSGGRLKVAWMDGHTGVNRVYFADTDTKLPAFTVGDLAPDSYGAQGHPKIVARGTGVVAVWDESTDVAKPAAPKVESGHGHGAPSRSGSGREIRWAIAGDGQQFCPSAAVSPRPGVFQLNPSVAILGDNSLLVTWNELDDSGKRVVVARVAP